MFVLFVHFICNTRFILQVIYSPTQCQGPHHLPVWDFRLEEARNHWIAGDSLYVPGMICQWHISRYVEKAFDVTFLPGALSPVTASNGGAGGVFLDGTGGYCLLDAI